MSCVDTEFLKVFDGGRTKQVTSHSRHHEHIRATKTGSHCLIRAFAAESQIKFLTKDCFPRLGKPIRERCQVDIGTSDHRNSRASGHGFLQRTLENAEFIWRRRLCQSGLVTSAKEEYSYTLSASSLKEIRCSHHRV